MDTLSCQKPEDCVSTSSAQKWAQIQRLFPALCQQKLSAQLSMELSKTPESIRGPEALSRYCPEYLTEKNLKILLKNPQQIESVAELAESLADSNEHLDLMAKIFNMGEYLGTIPQGLMCLKINTPSLFQTSIIEKLFFEKKNAWIVAQIIALLYAHDIRVNDTLIDEIIEQGVFTFNIVIALRTLELHPHLFTEDNIKNLVESAHLIADLDRAIATRLTCAQQQKKSPEKLLTQQELDLLLITLKQLPEDNLFFRRKQVYSFWIIQPQLLHYKPLLTPIYELNSSQELTIAGHLLRCLLEYDVRLLRESIAQTVINHARKHRPTPQIWRAVRASSPEALTEKMVRILLFEIKNYDAFDPVLLNRAKVLNKQEWEEILCHENPEQYMNVFEYQKSQQHQERKEMAAEDPNQASKKRPHLNKRLFGQI